MFSPAIIAGLVLGLAQIPSGVAQPLNASDVVIVNSTDLIITHVASDYFPNAKSDLSRFDVDVRFVGYNAKTRSWLTGLDPASGGSDEEKAMMITSAAYAKPFDTNDPDMTEDVNSLLAAINGNATTVRKRTASSLFKVAAAHAVAWHTCSNLWACVSGTTCTFSVDVGQAPRSECKVQGTSNCCVSWSNYNVRAGFFSTTWTTCNDEVIAEKKSTASCQGYGSSAQGGDVCLSNRANGCT